MSSQLIGEIELSLRESLESQITPNENLDDEITIDFSPFVDDREAEDYDRSSEEGRALFSSMTSEIIKPVNEIKFYRFFQIGEVTPVRINYYTYDLFINSIIAFSINPEMMSQYKSVIPHIYKILFVLPPLHTVLSIPGTAQSSEIGAVSVFDTLSISSSRSIPRNNRTASRSSESKTMVNIKSIHPITTDIPKSFVQKKTEDMERYISEMIKNIPDRIVIRCISDSLKNIKGGYKIGRQTNKTAIKNLLRSQILDPITEFFEMIWDYDTTSNKNALECCGHFSFARMSKPEPSSDISLRSNVELITPDFSFINTTPSTYPRGYNLYLADDENSQEPEVELVIDVERPFVFLDTIGKPIQFEKDMEISDIFRQSMKYCDFLGMDYGCITDGICFFFFIVDDCAIDNSERDCGHDMVCFKQKVYKFMTFNGIDEKHRPLFNPNDITTSHLIGLLLFLSKKKLLCGSNSKDGKEKMEHIMSKGARYTAGELVDASAEKLKKMVDDMELTKDNEQIDKQYTNGTCLNSASVLTSSSTGAKNITLNFPTGFKDYKVIQDSFENLTQIILLKRTTFEQILMNLNKDISINFQGECEAEDDYDIFLELYSINYLKSVYFLRNDIERYSDYFRTDEAFIDDILSDDYESEVKINQTISIPNNSVHSDSTMTKREINFPKMISYGSMVSGEYLSSFYGFYIAFEYIKSDGDLEAKHLS